MRNSFVLLLVLAGCSSGPDPDVNSPHPYGRYLGALDLVSSPNAENVRTLVRLLDDPEYLVRSGAVVALARIGRPEFTQQLLPKLDPNVESSAMVRSDVCLALEKLQHTTALEPLLATLKSDPEAVVRREAAKALRSFKKDQKMCQGLAEAVGDPDASVAWRSHLSLQELTGEKKVAMTTEAWSAFLKEHP
jgi:HEAT repeat protein